MGTKAVAVLDVGKTNKKVRIYGRGFQVLGEERSSFESFDMDGLEVENTAGLIAWFKDVLRRLAADYEIRAISISAHGATFAALDAQGILAHPVISYTAEKGAEVQERFYQEFGDAAALHRETCTPDLGFANLAKQLMYIKVNTPHIWDRMDAALCYNSFLGYELTGVKASEPTYVGNHNYLWDFRNRDWSAVGRALGADTLFPKPSAKSWECLGPVTPEIARECGLPEDCKVTMGLHDSNANLLPYLAQGYEDFVLNSTGTWCVLMRLSEEAALTDEDIAEKVFYNLDVYGRPVRTSVFPAGMEYDTFRGLTSHDDNGDLEALERVVAEKSLFVIPGVLPDAAPFSGAAAGVVNAEEHRSLQDLQAADHPLSDLGQDYLAALNLSLALATRKKLALLGISEGTKVFIEGGFANNATYCGLLAAMCPGQEILLTDVKEGTSFGAALAAWMLEDGLTPEQIGGEFNINASPVAPIQPEGLQEYERAFLDLVEQ